AQPFICHFTNFLIQPTGISKYFCYIWRQKNTTHPTNGTFFIGTGTSAIRAADAGRISDRKIEYYG
ncbi:hypothetical protein, partial [Alistipes putredinis]|uniref:hypothetical protein n=1 Tax=Alistipes putredinis TaxID=28117 RepID=UPI002FE21B3A